MDGDGRELGELLARLDAGGPLLGRLRRRGAARALARTASPAAIAGLARAYVSGRDSRVVAIAEEVLTGLDDQESVDAVCDVLVETGDERLFALVTRAGHQHSDPMRQTALLFLTGNTEFDTGSRGLAAALAAADEELRARLADRARVSARMDWVRAILGKERLDEVIGPEWDAVIATLSAHEAWEQMWRLVTHAPPQWSVRMVRTLAEQEWRPEDQTAFAELAELASRCAGDPAKGYADTPLTKYTGTLHRLVVTPDGTLLAGAVLASGVRLWHLPSGAPAGALADEGHWTDLRVLTNGDLIAGSGPDMVRIWQLPSGRRAGTIPIPPDIEGTPHHARIATTAEDELLVTTGTGWMRIWRPPWTEPGRRIGELTLADHRPWLLANGGHVVGATAGGIEIVDLSSDERISCPPGHKGAVRCLVATPDGRLVASSGRDGTVRLWRLPGGEAAGVLTGHVGQVGHLAVAPNGKLLASTGKDGTVRLWRLPSGKPAGVLPHRATHLEFAPDGKLLVSAGEGPIRLWRLPSGEPVGELTGSKGRVTSLAVTPDSGLLAGGADSGGLRLWRLWHPALTTACRTPLSRLDPHATDRLESACRGRAEAERDWARMIAALVRWRAIGWKAR
ncbi:WD40 repeat domain-containing protein [Nonomuraea sp. NPDC050451]|uniref:WD40 repeat domain-containing protein n=1 Tax=Nonomuraea sp. NPDC050451 TaxID=3364364 RepID=UPI0037ABA1D6